MKKTRQTEESYEACDFCGAEMCEKCRYPADHYSEPDWQGMSDCSGWRCKELCCCEKRFYQLEYTNADWALTNAKAKLYTVEKIYQRDKEKFEVEIKKEFDKIAALKEAGWLAFLKTEK